MFHFIGLKWKYYIFVDFAHVLISIDIKRVSDKFEEDWVIFRGCTLWTLYTLHLIYRLKKQDFQLLLFIFSNPSHKTKLQTRLRWNNFITFMSSTLFKFVRYDSCFRSLGDDFSVVLDNPLMFIPDWVIEFLYQGNAPLSSVIHYFKGINGASQRIAAIPPHRWPQTIQRISLYGW